MKFIMERETNNRINFLDITITKEHDKLTFDIYRKPNRKITDSIIPYHSCHPTEHKLAAVRYLTNRMNTYHLNTANKEKEKNIIKHILQKNKYDISAMNIPLKTHGNKSKAGQKWAKFTYVGRETKFITKLFKNSSVNVSYTTHNTISKLLSHRPTTNQNKFDGIGVYQLTCPDCKMKYVGQTERSFYTRFHEHFRDFKYANQKSKFAQHLLENNHSIGPIDNIMEVLHHTKKGKLMDTLERFHIYKVTHENIQINDKNKSRPNVIFDKIIQGETNRQPNNR